MNKCEGIKILELDPKRILEGNEYMVIAEKDQNFKAPINQIVDLVVSDDRLKNYIDTTIESSIGDFKIVKAYQMKGSDMGVTGQSFVFADKDGWVSEEGMPNKIWVGEAVSYNGRWYKINQVDDSVEGMPNLIIQRDLQYKGSLVSSVNGYITVDNKQYKVWNQQTNINGVIIPQASSKCINTNTMTEEGVIKVIAMNENGTIYNDSISTAFRYGYVAGNSEKRGQQFIRSYVTSRNSSAANEEFAVVNYFDKTEAGQVVALNPIT